MAVWAARLDVSCVALYLVSGGESLVEARPNLKLECLITLEKWKGQNRTGMTKSIEHLERVQASVLTVISLFLLLKESTFKCSSKKIFALNSVVLSFPPFSPLFSFSSSSCFQLLLLLLLSPSPPPSSPLLLSYFLHVKTQNPLPSPPLPTSRLGCSPWVGIRIRPREGIQDDTTWDIHGLALRWSLDPSARRPQCVGTLVALPHIPVTDFIYRHTHT